MSHLLVWLILVMCGPESSRFWDCKLLEVKESTFCSLLHFQWLSQCFVLNWVLDKYTLDEIAAFAKKSRGKIGVYSALSVPNPEPVRISVLVKGRDVLTSPLIPKIILTGFRKDRGLRGKQVLGWTYFGLELKAMTLTTLGRLIFSLLNLKKHIQQIWVNWGVFVLTALGRLRYCIQSIPNQPRKTCVQNICRKVTDQEWEKWEEIFLKWNVLSRATSDAKMYARGDLRLIELYPVHLSRCLEWFGLLEFVSCQGPQ